MRATVRVDATRIVAPVPRRLFGTFVEHMGRGVYEGIYEPSHPTADSRGFRRDVLDLVRELGATVVRYPGGNFVSGYRWEDGVGPVATRPRRLDAAWHSLETNEVGLHEFAEWAADAGLELMEAVNLGTRGVDDAAALLEYANISAGTARSEERRANGRGEPFDITLWCLGNEVDGPWQIGHKTADEYGRLAAETARLMRFIDSRVELVAAGSSNREMPTFGEWERTVLAHTAGLIDHISIHAYYEQRDGDLASFLASSAHLERYIDDVAAIIDEVRAEYAIERRIGISVDEWNVWNQTRWNTDDKERVLTGGWPEHPRLIEDEYTVADAVVVGSLLIALLKHADRVSMANLAQLVNVIAPIRSEPGGAAWRQTTFFPFQLTAALARGAVAETSVVAPSASTDQHGEVALVDAITTIDGARMTVFLLNRSLRDAVDVRIDAGLPVADASIRILTIPEGGDASTSNTERAQPVAMTPSAVADPTALSLPPLSWSVLECTLGGAR